jgi:hypothetical protein
MNAFLEMGWRWALRGGANAPYPRRGGVEGGTDGISGTRLQLTCYTSRCNPRSGDTPVNYKLKHSLQLQLVSIGQAF